MGVRFNALSRASFALFAGWSLVATAAPEAPPCMDAGRRLEIANEQTLHWKRNTPNQYKARARVSGVLIREYADKTNHGHMKVQIGPQPDDTIEVIYNEDFGRLPNKIAPGSRIEACGDYITSNAPYGPYPASPDGAIIHWLHRSPRPGAHDHGWLTIEGVVFGMGPADRSPGEECRGRGCDDGRRDEDGDGRKDSRRGERRDDRRDARRDDRRDDRREERRARKDWSRDRWEREHGRWIPERTELEDAGSASNESDFAAEELDLEEAI